MLLRKFDGIFDDFESRDVECHVGGTTDTEECAFYTPDSFEEYRHHDTGNDMRISAKYDTAVDFLGFTMADDDYNKIM